MSKTLIIAEKPSVAQDIVRALTPVTGKFEKHAEHFDNDTTIVTSAVGIDTGPTPTVLVAATVNVYFVPFDNPVTTQDNETAAVEHVAAQYRHGRCHRGAKRPIPPWIQTTSHRVV